MATMVRNKMILALLFSGFALLAAGCSLDRTDPKVVSETTFRAILRKDYQQLRQLVGCGAVIPDEQSWKDASFIQDRTAGERIKQGWMKATIGAYTLNNVVMEDPQQPSLLFERLVQVRFAVSGKGYVATFPIILCENKWSPGMNLHEGDFFVRFADDTK